MREVREAREAREEVGGKRLHVGALEHVAARAAHEAARHPLAAHVVRRTLELGERLVARDRLPAARAAEAALVPAAAARREGLIGHERLAAPRARLLPLAAAAATAAAAAAAAASLQLAPKASAVRAVRKPEVAVERAVEEVAAAHR